VNQTNEVTVRTGSDLDNLTTMVEDTDYKVVLNSETIIPTTGRIEFINTPPVRGQYIELSINTNFQRLTTSVTPETIRADLIEIIQMIDEVDRKLDRAITLDPTTPTTQTGVLIDFDTDLAGRRWTLDDTRIVVAPDQVEIATLNYNDTHNPLTVFDVPVGLILMQTLNYTVEPQFVFVNNIVDMTSEDTWSVTYNSVEVGIEDIVEVDTQTFTVDNSLDQTLDTVNTVIPAPVLPYVYNRQDPLVLPLFNASGSRFFPGAVAYDNANIKVANTSASTLPVAESRVLTSNNSRATVDLGDDTDSSVFTDTDRSPWIYVSDFDINIPDGKTITGLEIILEGFTTVVQSSGSTGGLNVGGMIHNSTLSSGRLQPFTGTTASGGGTGAIEGLFGGTTVNFFAPDEDEVVGSAFNMSTFNGASDIAGSDLNASTWGVAVRLFKSRSGSASGISIVRANIDSISVRIYYDDSDVDTD